MGRMFPLDFWVENCLRLIDAGSITEVSGFLSISLLLTDFWLADIKWTPDWTCERWVYF
jgi:hypothetical protein